MAIAIDASVTVSIPALISGIWSCTPSNNRVETSTSLGSTSDLAGISNTSSNVSPSLENFSSHIDSTDPFVRAASTFFASVSNGKKSVKPRKEVLVKSVENETVPFVQIGEANKQLPYDPARIIHSLPSKREVG